MSGYHNANASASKVVKRVHFDEEALAWQQFELALAKVAKMKALEERKERAAERRRAEQIAAREFHDFVWNWAKKVAEEGGGGCDCF